MKKAIRKVVGVLLLVTALILTQIPAPEVAADTSVASDFQLNGSTLVKYVGTASTVSIPATVNRIGEEAFAGNTTVKYISFKGEVEEIAYRAFAGCSELKEVVLPDSVIELGNGAFSDCDSLKIVEIGDELKTLGIGVFAGCGSLKEIIIDKNHEHFKVSDGCLYDKDMTKLYLLIPVREKETYSMPSTVTDIAEYAFWGCNSVKNLSISNIIEEIPAYSFSNCKSLQAVSVPASVRRIDVRAFEDCVSLENVWIPSSVNTIHSTAFDGCPKLQIIADVGTKGYTYYEDWLKRHKDQSEYEDTGNNEGEDPTEPDYVPGEDTGDKQSILGQTQIVGNSAFVFIDNTLPNVLGAPDPVEEEEKDEGEEDTDGVFEEAEDKVISIPKFTVTGENILADQAYYKSEDVADYVMPDGITKIGEFAFARSNLEKIAIPQSVTSIGYGAFYYCKDLRNVTIPSTVTDIAPRAFDGSLWIENWMAGGNDDFLVVGDGILLAYRGSYAVVTIPENVKKIAPGAFANHNELVQVVFPDGMREIGEGAFAGCINLSSLQGGKYITKIEDNAFEDCPIQTFHVTKEVKEIGLGAIDFSKTQKSTSTKVVVFEHEETLPTISYEDTATRLSNDKARTLVLNDVLVAVVSSKISEDDLAGTVLDAQNYGFRGIVGYISSESRSIITAITCNLTPDELQEAYIPEYIYIDGKTYKVEGLDDMSYGISQRPQESYDIQVVNEAEVLGLASRIKASLEGDVSSLYLKVADGDEGIKEKLDTSFQNVYKQNLPRNTVYFTMELFDLNSDVSIKKLGNNSLQVVMPVPKIEGTGSIRIVTMDRNGQLESVPYHYDEEGNLVMTLSHLSPFGIYRTNVNLSSRMDESPDTGDTFQPKWLFAAGLFSLSMAVIFYKPRKRKYK
ncbi:MAG: leucine-rich repeat domain-containing protein [Lachnospiraceae bacterium]|nr:leucine-rich repeat domain-containing protein [Lachnospiraceae bacterium]